MLLLVEAIVLPPPSNFLLVSCYIATLLLGGAIGISELISRYRDAPLRALLTQPASLYIAFNAAAAILALAAVRQFHLLEDKNATDLTNVLILQTVVAGVSAMALFRTSVFTIRVGNSDIGIGPAAFLQILLNAADRACDRTRAKPRATAVQAIMAGISFQKASVALPTLCFGLMQNVSSDEQGAFSSAVRQLKDAPMDDAFKGNSLGLALMNLVGENVLRQAVDMLRADIAAPPRTIVQSIPTLQLMRNVQYGSSAKQMVDMCFFLTNSFGDEKLVAQLTDTLGRIDKMTVSDRQKTFFLSAALIGRFGEDTFQSVLKALPENASALRGTGPQGSGQPAAMAASVSGSPSSSTEKVVDLNTRRPETQQDDAPPNATTQIGDTQRPSA
jgi:hypothetical protein